MVAEPDWLSWIEPDGIHLNSDGHSWVERQVVSGQRACNGQI